MIKTTTLPRRSFTAWHRKVNGYHWKPYAGHVSPMYLQTIIEERQRAGWDDEWRILIDGIEPPEDF